MLFSLKLQRNDRKNAPAVAPAKGKLGKRLYFHRTVEMKQPHIITEPLKIIEKANVPQQQAAAPCPCIVRKAKGWRGSFFRKPSPKVHTSNRFTSFLYVMTRKAAPSPSMKAMRGRNTGQMSPARKTV